MITNKQSRKTRLTELVETHNIATSLKRLNNLPSYDENRWKRALYHAIAMSHTANNSTIEKFRQAMELP